MFEGKKRRTLKGLSFVFRRAWLEPTASLLHYPIVIHYFISCTAECDLISSLVYNDPCSSALHERVYVHFFYLMLCHFTSIGCY